MPPRMSQGERNRRPDVTARLCLAAAGWGIRVRNDCRYELCVSDRHGNKHVDRDDPYWGDFRQQYLEE